jgi:4'-phosphopantetheinyl transferase
VPEADAVEVWLVDVDAVGPALDAIERRRDFLPHAEKARAAAMNDVDARTRWIRGRVALRALLAERIGYASARLTFEILSSGRPTLPGQAFAFSLSHSDALVLIAVSAHEAIGVDIETRLTLALDAVRQARVEAAAAAFSPRLPLPLPQDPRRPVQCWTRLEALAKATGLGIGAVLERLGIHGPSADIASRPMSDAARLLVETHELRVADLALGSAAVGSIALPRGAGFSLRRLSPSDLEPAA